MKSPSRILPSFPTTTKATTRTYSHSQPSKPAIMAKDEEYESAVKKGSQLLDMVLSGNSTSTQEPSPKAPQTKFTAVSDLSKYGYTNDLTSSKSGRSVVRHLASAFHALNINAEMVVDGGNNTMVEHEHLESRTIDGVFYPVSHLCVTCRTVANIYAGRPRDLCSSLQSSRWSPCRLQQLQHPVLWVVAGASGPHRPAVATLV